MDIYRYDDFDFYKYRKKFVVLEYDKKGNGIASVYCDSLNEAVQERSRHGLLIGLKSGYRDFPKYPTIFEWKVSDDPFFADRGESYHRLIGY